MQRKLEELKLKRKEYQIASNNILEVKILKEICELVLKIYGKFSNEYIYYLNELGGASKYIGEYELGLKKLYEAKEILKETVGEKSSEYATCLLNIAEVLRFQGSLDKIESIYLEVEKIYINNKMEKEYRYAGLCNNIGLYYQNINNISKAINYHERSLEILKNMEENKVEYATTLNNLVIPYKSINEKEKAYKYLEEAMNIYEKYLGKYHSMYSATLNNKAILKFEEGEFISSLNYFEKSLEIVKKSFGENSVNYKNLLSNVLEVKKIIKENEKKEKIKIDINENSKLIDISREYTNKYILPKIKEKKPELLKKITIALLGEGSEVIGYDDEYSKDHDYTFMPIIFLNDEDYNKYYNELKDIMYSLPFEFMGIKHVENDVILERRGIQKISAYLFKFLGKENIELTINDYRMIPEHSFFSLTNGEIFYKGNNELIDILDKISYYPDVIRENMIATRCTKIAQSGQYNYLRLLKRNDKIGASLSLNEFIENTISLVFLLNKKYMPFYKWKSKMLKELDILGEEIYKRINDILLNFNEDMHKSSNRVEEICYYLVEELKRQKLSNEKGYFLTKHAIYIQKNIDDDILRILSPYKD